MPPEDILIFFNALKDLPFAHASCPAFWGATTLYAIRKNLIKSPLWLCVDADGREEKANLQISKALKYSNSVSQIGHKSDDGKKIPTIDRLTRRILRWLMGPPEIRGAPTLYTNCSFAKAWWCGWFADRCVLKNKLYGCNINMEDSVKSLHQIWHEFAPEMSGGLPVVREESLVHSLMQWSKGFFDNSEEKYVGAKATKKIKTLGAVSESRAIGLLNPQEIKKEFIDIEQ